MAEITIRVTNYTAQMCDIFLKNLTENNKLFLCGWLDISTGKWTMDDETISKVFAEQQYPLNYPLVVAQDMEQTGTIRVLKFYYPPIEFDDNELFITATRGSLTLPAGKWEAGQSYTYTINCYNY